MRIILLDEMRHCSAPLSTKPLYPGLRFLASCSLISHLVSHFPLSPNMIPPVLSYQTAFAKGSVFHPHVLIGSPYYWLVKAILLHKEDRYLSRWQDQVLWRVCRSMHVCSKMAQPISTTMHWTMSHFMGETCHMITSKMFFRKRH